jgi:uncharacterized protein
VGAGLDAAGLGLLSGKGVRMKYLFFFVHPSKCHLFRITINQLIRDGHSVKVLITKKDVLEDLVEKEKWDWTNVFPEGRKIKGLPKKAVAAFNTFRTLVRLDRYSGDEKYDLFVTDDLLTLTGRFRKTPSILFQDDDLDAVPETRLLLSTANHILAPACADFGRYNRKKIGFRGFKASAYLHPDRFNGSREVVSRYGLSETRYFVIRLVSLKSMHDVGKKGLDDSVLGQIIQKLAPHGRVLISSERAIGAGFGKYRMDIAPGDLLHLVCHSELFVSDSQTMSMEAGYLGTPFVRFNDFVEKISYLKEMEARYGLGFGFLTRDKDGLFRAIDGMLARPNLKDEWKVRRKRMLEETIDLSSLMIRLFEEYPKSLMDFREGADAGAVMNPEGFRP